MIRIGLIGLGGIMNGKHIPDYSRCGGHQITAVCDIDPAALKKTGDKLAIPEEHRFLHYEDLMKSGLVDAVDIATPDYLHCPIAQAALAHNLPFSVEKPMGMNYTEVAQVCDKAASMNLRGAVCFSWHYRACIRKMKDIIHSGKLGKIYHIYIRTIKDSGLWDGRPLEWRFDGTKSASGVMGDLCSHMFDIARFAGSEFRGLVADAGIFVKERRELNGTRMLPVTTWDWCNVLAQMEDGANATFQISRTCKNVGDSTVAEFYGEKGKLKLYCSFSENTNYLEYQTDGALVHEDLDTSKDANQSEGFLHILTGETDGKEPTLEDGRKCQAALDAAFLSVAEKRWVSIEEIVKQKEGGAK